MLEQMEKSNDLKTWCDTINLGEMFPLLEKMGFSTLEELKSTKKDIYLLADEIGLRFGKKATFILEIQKLFPYEPQPIFLFDSKLSIPKMGFDEETKMECNDIWIHVKDICPFSETLDVLVRNATIGPEYERKWKDQKVCVLETPLKHTETMAKMVPFLKRVIQLSHPNVRKIHGISCTDSDLLIVQEPVGDELHILMKDVLPWKMRLQILFNIANGIIYLHKNGIILRNLHWDTILVRLDGTTVLSDYGLSQFSTPTGESYNQEPFWYTISPGILFPKEERFSKESWSKKSDCYSYGAIMYYLLTGQELYFYLDDKTKKMEALQNRIPVKLPTAEICPQMKHYPEGYIKLMYQCLHEVSIGRPTMETICERIQKMQKEVCALK